MKKFILAITIALFTSSAFAAGDCSNLTYNNQFPTSINPVQLICKNGFAIGYSTSMKSLLWVVERLDPQLVAQMNIKQRPPFHQDDRISPTAQSSNSDYASSGFDRGHMVPFEDMSFSQQSAYDSMSLTNIVPQNYVNNRGAWKSLEMMARKMGSTRTIFVISGPIYQGRIDTIGNRIPIPTAFFKIIIDPTTRQSKTYILPNRPAGVSDIPSFVSTRAQVQKMAGIIATPNASLVDSR